MPRTKHRPTVSLPFAEDDLVPAVASELKNALAALRAALEGVARELGDEAPCHARLRRAVEQTFPIARQVEALVDCAHETPARPLSCSLREIACSTLRALAGSQASRCLLAIEDERQLLDVDGPLLVRTLTLLGECLLFHGDGRVLLRVSLREGSACFSFLWSSTGDEPHALSIQRKLVRREAQRLGARLAETRDANGCARIELRFARLDAERPDA